MPVSNDVFITGNQYTAAEVQAVAQAINGSGYLAPVRVATVTETLTITSGSVASIAGTTIDGATPKFLIPANLIGHGALTGRAGTKDTVFLSGAGTLAGAARVFQITSTARLPGFGALAATIAIQITPILNSYGQLTATTLEVHAVMLSGRGHLHVIARIVQPAPPQRTTIIPADSRVDTIPVDLRTDVVFADRLTVIPADIRTTGIPVDVRVNIIPADIHLDVVPPDERGTVIPLDVRTTIIPAEPVLNANTLTLV